MRRTSIVAPLLLIALGALFLARNLYPNLPFVDYLARFWPFVLIAWGGLRLAEILYWAAASKPLPSRGMSGGEWMVVVFLCLFGVSLHAVNGIQSWWPRDGFALRGLDIFGERFEYPVAAERAVSKTPRVVIESFRGDARVIGTDAGADTGSVKVTGNKTIRSLEQRGADRANELAPLELTGDANQVVIRTNQDRVAASQRISEEMDIVVPKGASIEAHGRAGNFDLSNIAGNVDVSSDNAGVRLENIGGAVVLDLRRSDSVRAVNVKGGLNLKGRGSDIEIEGVDGPVTVSGVYTGAMGFRKLSKPLRLESRLADLNIEQVPGEVSMPLGNFTASNLVGPIRLSARSRDVQIADFTNALEISLDRGDVELRPGKLPLSKMDVHTKSGDVTLSLPEGAKFDLTAETARGEASNEFGAPLTVDSRGRGAAIRGSNGGAQIRIETERGRVVVRKASPNDRPFAPSTRDFTTTLPDQPLKKIAQ